MKFLLPETNRRMCMARIPQGRPKPADFSPGYIGTAMVTAIPEEVLNTKIIPQIPLGRLGKPEEVAGLCAYLASDEAAFITGANIAINGGQHMQ